MLPAIDLVVRVDPARGAKITSLVDADGTEWLTQSDGRGIPAPGTSFVDAEMARWDECAPTIASVAYMDSIGKTFKDAKRYNQCVELRLMYVTYAPVGWKRYAC